MFRGNTNNNRGVRGARGGPRGRGRGRARGRGRGKGGPGYDLSTETDFIIQMYPDNSNRGGYASPGSRGRGIGSPSRGYESPRGRGRGRGDFDSSRDRGRGRGGPRLRPDAPLSKLLYEERPLLRPIKFVRSVHHATLFQEEEELLQPIVEDVGDEEQSHVPTADSVSRVFSGGNIPRIESENEEETLEEIDFEDLGKIREEVDAAASRSPALPVAVQAVEERFTGIFIGKPQPQSSTPDTLMAKAPSEKQHVESVTQIALEAVPTDLFYVDTTPTPVQPSTSALESQPTTTSAPSEIVSTQVPPPAEPAAQPIAVDSAAEATPTELFYIDTTPTLVTTVPSDIQAALAPLRDYPTFPDDEEVIVYVAPHPRAGRAPSPSPPPVEAPTLSSTSILTGMTIIRTTPPPAPAFGSVSFAFTPSPKKPRRQPPAFTVGGHVKAKTKARALSRRVERRATFGSFGARMSEAQLRDDDPRWDERRRGDSDIDWGDEVDGPDEEEAGGMDIDVDLDPVAMRRFATGMGADGGRFMTMNDIQDEQRMREEDADVRAPGSSSEGDDEDESSEDDDVDAIVDAEENIMVGEPGDLPSEDSDESEDEDDSDDEGQSPRTGFQARLERLRKAARERGPDDSLDYMEADESSDDDDFLEGTWAERDDDYVAQIQAFLDENGDILSASSRQGRKKLLKAVANGEIVDFEGLAPAPRGKKKREHLPAELQAVWDKDRQKKAENKRLRALARAEAAADPLSFKNGGKKGRKAMLAAAKLDPTITVLPNRVIDMTTLVQQIRRFVADIGGPATMSLPPTDKETRKNIHEMAIAFNLKSVSKGKGDGRYTTLTKTTRSGWGVNEAKVAKIARRGGSGRGGAAFVRYEGGDKGKNRATAMPRHKDGDEVGKAAPKIGESNIGFKMLASMGWTEGERIGVSAGGLHIPLTAVIKNTKLGLGATR